MIQNLTGEIPLTLIDLITSAGPMAKGVLLLLMFFSIISWAIIFHKFFIYRTARREDELFLSVFEKSSNLNKIFKFASELSQSPLARIFLTGYHELYVFREMSKNRGKKSSLGNDLESLMKDFEKLDQLEKTSPSSKGNRGGIPALSSRDIKGIGIALDKAINHEVERLSRRLEFLATTGSATPFIGLFGTVWGIMHSFRAVGLKGTASIGGVAPGIAEALVATAAGLVAAIPAVIFFNYLNQKTQTFTTRMDDFSQEFLFMAEKNFQE
tara:strand:+ start:789 stop:1595 length:807 start_codon:yes stop_codon:yes gene_type:complete